MKISCKVIEDLLPLYHDDACSADSMTLVDEHLRQCESCKRTLIAMDGEFEVPEADHDGQKALEGIHNTWKRSKRKALIKGIAIALAVIMIGFCAVSAYWYYDCVAFYQQFADRMATPAQYPHEYIEPTDPETGEPESPPWYFLPKEYSLFMGGYQYWLRMPSFLSFQGSMLIEPVNVYLDSGTGGVVILNTGIHVRAGIVFDDKQPLYCITIYDNTEGEEELYATLLVDGDLNLLKGESYGQTAPSANGDAYLELYSDQILELITAAKDLWGLE